MRGTDDVWLEYFKRERKNMNSIRYQLTNVCVRLGLYLQAVLEIVDCLCILLSVNFFEVEYQLNSNSDYVTWNSKVSVTWV